MKKFLSVFLIACMMVSVVPSCTWAAEKETNAILLDVNEHVEIKGDSPVYPDAPKGYSSYDDYRNKNGYVHDTEFYYDQEEKIWYYYITNSSEIRSSDNLVNWTKEKTNRNGNAWAPCIVKLRRPVEFEGNTYTYALWDSLSTFGTRESWIRLWLSNSPKEGFVYAGDTVTSLLNDGLLHNAIDPTVFYDEDGTMWMTFGSFFGGIYLFEMNQKTLMPAYKEDVTANRIVYRSEYLNSIEGATIIYNPDTDYYYLAVSYGSLDHTYNVRIGRSKNVEGPYYDYNGMPLNNEGYTNNQTNQIGTKITSPYSFDYDKGWYSTGHCSFLYNPDTNEYFMSNNARQETVNGTRLNIRKLYWTNDGWPVVSPELYVEGKTDQAIPTKCIAGTYEFIELFRDDLPISPLSAVKRTSSKIQLHEDHSITGAYTGTWIQSDEHTLKLALGDTIYNVTVDVGWDWEKWTSCLIFTGLSEAAETQTEVFANPRSGLGIWGKKVTVQTNVLADFTFDDENTGFASENAKAAGGHSLVSYNGGKALSLNGTSDFLRVTDKNGKALLAGQEELTIALKLNPDRANYSNWIFYAAPDEAAQTYQYEKYLGLLDRENSIYVERFENDGARPRVPEGAKPQDGWYYLTIVIKPNESIVYVNGKETGRARSDIQLSDLLTADGLFYIGKANWSENGEYYRGLMDDYLILDRGLDAVEVENLYEGMKQPSVLELHITEPAKTTYQKGEELDLTGFKAVAQYNNYRTSDVTDLCKVSGFNPDKAGEQEIVVSYDGKETAFTIFVQGQTLPYVDVKESDWFYDAVEYNYYAGTMTGMDVTHFAPYGQLSRAQFALMLYRMNQTYTVSDTFDAADTSMANDSVNSPFLDVTGDEWYGEAVLWAAKNGIVTGYLNGCFGPSDLITREQMAVMLYRFYQYLDKDIIFDADYSSFLDAGDVSEFAASAMRWMVGQGVITGKEQGTKLDPQGTTLRAEAAAMLYRLHTLEE